MIINRILFLSINGEVEVYRQTFVLYVFYEYFLEINFELDKKINADFYYNRLISLLLNVSELTINLTFLFNSQIKEQ